MDLTTVDKLLTTTRSVRKLPLSAVRSSRVHETEPRSIAHISRMPAWCAVTPHIIIAWSRTIHQDEGGCAHIQFFGLVLGKVTNAQALGLHHFAAIGLQPCRDQFDQGRFTITVGPQQRNAIIAV